MPSAAPGTQQAPQVYAVTSLISCPTALSSPPPLILADLKSASTPTSGPLHVLLLLPVALFPQLTESLLPQRLQILVQVTIFSGYPI